MFVRETLVDAALQGCRIMNKLLTSAGQIIRPRSEDELTGPRHDQRAIIGFGVVSCTVTDRRESFQGPWRATSAA